MLIVGDVPSTPNSPEVFVSTGPVVAATAELLSLYLIITLALTLPRSCGFVARAAFDALTVKFSVVVTPPAIDVTESALTIVKFEDAFCPVASLSNVINALVSVAVDAPPLVTGMEIFVVLTRFVVFVIQE